MIIFLHRHQKLTFSGMWTPQCHEINVMTFGTECHEIRFLGRKTNVMTLMSWDLEYVMTFIFSGTGVWSSVTYSKTWSNWPHQFALCVLHSVNTGHIYAGITDQTESWQGHKKIKYEKYWSPTNCDPYKFHGFGSGQWMSQYKDAVLPV